NSLGNTIEVVEEVLAEPVKFDQLFNCYFSSDEIVRLRVSNAMKRVCKANKPLLIPYIGRLINEISLIDQASTQWTLSTLFGELEKSMSVDEQRAAEKIMRKNLANHKDWIVLNTTLDTLSKWAKKDDDLKEWMRPHLDRLATDDRKTVAKRANKILSALYQQ
ncbi:MAG: hypothetical protein AAFN93_26710, partial [Bacteroidota bacterium]